MIVVDWTPLDRELALWADQGLTLPLWWRDDDAIAPTPALDQLSALSDDVGLPVHLAVIPSLASDPLADSVTLDRALIPVVHGWTHSNHAPAPEKKAEFGAHRPTNECLDDARNALARAKDLFGDALCPMFVPPWNRIAPDVVAGLSDLGFSTLSTFTPRKATQAAPGLEQINTHLDPIDWKTTRSLVEPNRLIAQIVAQLTDRRQGRADAEEPYGLLTHHLAHDAAIWDFMSALLHRLMAGPVRPWIAPPADATKKDPS